MGFMIHRCQGKTNGTQCPATTDVTDVRIGTWNCPAHATVAHRCALCDEVLSTDGNASGHALDLLTQQHHAVCPKRQVAVSDEVEWRPDGSSSSASGIVYRISPGRAVIKILSVSRIWTAYEPCPMLGELRNVPSETIRRIPRPAAAQGFSPGERVVWRPTPGSPWASLAVDGEVVSVRGDNRRVWMMRVLAVAGEVPNNLPPPIGSILDLTAAPGKVERVPVCAPGCQCGGHAVPKYRPVVVDKAEMERAIRDEKLMQLQQDAAEARLRHLCSPPSAPALVDGLTRDACLTRWLENRRSVERGVAPPHVMTRMQRDVGRLRWLQTFGAAQAAELRMMVLADREAERNQVRVEVQDVE